MVSFHKETPPFQKATYCEACKSYGIKGIVVITCNPRIEYKKKRNNKGKDISQRKYGSNKVLALFVIEFGGTVVVCSSTRIQNPYRSVVGEV